MKKTFNFAIALMLASILFISCKSLIQIPQTYMAVYNVSLSSVESPENARETFGETKIVTLEESDSISSYSYEDRFAKFIWFVHTDKFSFLLDNRSGHSMRICWDDVSYVNYNGYADRMIHKGVKLIDADKQQGSINIPNGSRLSDILIPASNIKFHEGGAYISARWEIESLIPCYYNNREDMMRDIEDGTYVGKKIKILFPIEIEGVRNDYCFEFTVNRYGSDPK